MRLGRTLEYLYQAHASNNDKSSPTQIMIYQLIKSAANADIQIEKTLTLFYQSLASNLTHHLQTNIRNRQNIDQKPFIADTFSAIQTFALSLLVIKQRGKKVRRKSPSSHQQESLPALKAPILTYQQSLKPFHLKRSQQ